MTHGTVVGAKNGILSWVKRARLFVKFQLSHWGGGGGGIELQLGFTHIYSRVYVLELNKREGTAAAVFNYAPHYSVNVTGREPGPPAPER